MIPTTLLIDAFMTTPEAKHFLALRRMREHEFQRFLFEWRQESAACDRMLEACDRAAAGLSGEDWL